MATKKIKFDEIKLEGQYYITLKFSYDKELHSQLLELGCKYNPGRMDYYILNLRSNYLRLVDVLGKSYELNLYTLKQKFIEREINRKPEHDLMEMNLRAREWFHRFDRYLSSKRYSDQTRKSYLGAVKQFLAYFGDMDPIEIGNEEVNKYNHDYIIPKGYSVSAQRQFISAIKLFFGYAKGEQMLVEKLELPKKQQLLPRLLSVEEVRKMIEVSINLKHKTILMVLYGTGIRMSELLNLQIRDIDSNQKVIHILKGKGQKDRNVQLTDNLLHQLRIYYLAYRPKVYLFEGAKGHQYSQSSVNNTLKKLASRAGVNKRVSAHMIRHSYATHMMDKGVSLRFIQELLGHKSSKTTEIYTHVSQKNIKDLSNPLDDFTTFVGEAGINYNKSGDNPPY